MVRLAGGDEVEGLDEEFLFHLNRGSELLVRGEAEPARASLERALELRQKDVKVLGLLGQAYYKLSRFDDAAKVWQRLVDDNPVEPSARVNLGLACLKAKRHPDAVKQLEIALDLNPEHKKAMGYLGLALLESGNLTRAREWFMKAGSDQMVARCDDLIAGRGAVAAHPASEASARAQAAREAEAAAAQAEAEPPSPEPLRTVRLDGVFATQGRVALSGEVKRFRGRATEKPFGEGATRMYRASGDGVLLYRTQGRRFSALDLGTEAAYLREEVLFGFEEGIAFENGRVQSSISAELNLVHLRGRGRFLLSTIGEPVAVDVAPQAPLKVPLAALVGWIGALTPRVCALLDGSAQPSEPVVVAVELAGEGRVLADPAAGFGAGS